jgi:transcriptional regulator with XRE-family HTH domain
MLIYIVKNVNEKSLTLLNPVSDFKTPEQVEFCELFAQLEAIEISASDVARELKISPAAISLILKGKRSPREMTLVAMRRFVQSQTGAMVMREGGADEHWRIRAETAERELENIKDSLRQILTGSGTRISYVRQAPNTRVDELANKILNRAVESVKKG